MNDGGSSAGQVVSKETDEIIQGVCRAQSGADDFIRYHAHPVEYVRRSVFVRE